MKARREHDDFLKMKKIILCNGNLDVKIVSNSMEPLILTNEVINVVNLVEGPKKFDIIVFWRDCRFVAHFIWRINGISHLTYTTRSLQNRSSNEAPVELDEILGIISSKKIGFLDKLIMRVFYA